MSEGSPTAPKAERLVSLDAFRGAIMLMMASAGFGLARVADGFPESGGWGVIGYHFEHAPWRGCSLWDLIQPAFMFMVGVALPWSVANRRARGQGFGTMFGHALWRSAVLVLLAVFLSSAWSGQTNWVFANVLAQIGLGYPFLFLVAFGGRWVPWIVAGGVLVLYWLAFALYPVAGEGFDWGAVGVAGDWVFLSGFEAHWEKNANFAAWFDRWFLNLFPRGEVFAYSGGGYATLNFVPSIATMIFGLCAGRLLRGELTVGGKLRRLVVAGVVGILLGWLIDISGVCPVVKRIWTPSWAIYSAGWVALMLAGFYAVVDGLKWRRWTLPLVVVGLNPITLYCLWQLSGGFIKGQMRTHFGPEVFGVFGEMWVASMERGTVLVVLWLVVFWMYRKKVFVRI